MFPARVGKIEIIAEGFNGQDGAKATIPGGDIQTYLESDGGFGSTITRYTITTARPVHVEPIKGYRTKARELVEEHVQQVLEDEDGWGDHQPNPGKLIDDLLDALKGHR